MSKFNLTSSELGVDSFIRFGKHQGEKVEDVIVDDPTYIQWAIDNVEGFELDEECLQLLETSLRSSKHG